MGYVDLALLRARLRGAQNSGDLPSSLGATIATAARIATFHIQMDMGYQTVSLRRYSITTVRKDSESTVVKRTGPSEYNIYTGKREERKETIRLEVDEEVYIWEVLEDDGDPTSFRSWIYLEATEALSAYAYLIMKSPPESHEDAGAGKVDVGQLLSTFCRDITFEDISVVPGSPYKENQSPASTLASMEILAIEARNSHASTTRRKRIAVDLYNQGLVNIRRIGMLTGLSRDTVYRALEENGIVRGGRSVEHEVVNRWPISLEQLRLLSGAIEDVEVEDDEFPGRLR